MQTISMQELKLHNGDGGTRRWVAQAGIVYDVTDCPKWRTGLHEQMHFPGQDLSGELADAPHGLDVFDRPCVKIIGHLVPQDA